MSLAVGSGDYIRSTSFPHLGAKHLEHSSSGQLDIQLACSLTIFEKHLKTFLFLAAFD